MVCLLCHRPCHQRFTWGNILWPGETQRLCHACKENFRPIQGMTCSACHRMGVEGRCEDCQRWTRVFKRDPLERNVSVFLYNDFMKELIAQWKYRGDYALVEIFKDPLIKVFTQAYSSLIKEAVLVPIPLSDDRKWERAFNQAEALANLLPHKDRIRSDLLMRRSGEKQAKKSKLERLSSENPFEVTKRVKRPIILIDDIYTTGTTLRHAARALIAKGSPAIYSVTLVRG